MIMFGMKTEGAMGKSSKNGGFSVIRIIVTLLMSSSLIACSTSEFDEKAMQRIFSQETLSEQETIEPFHTHQRVDDYTDKLAHDLVRNLIRQSKQPNAIAITPFVNFSGSDYDITPLGRVISHSLLGQVQEYGLAVVDTHLLNLNKVKDTGELAFSRDMNKLMERHGVDYILSGVMLRNERGMVINARVIEFGSRRVLSTASTFIPSFVADEI